MKLQTIDQGVSIIELDPTKHYWIIIDDEADIDPMQLQFGKNGCIIYKRKVGAITFIENSNAIVKQED